MLTRRLVASDIAAMQEIARASFSEKWRDDEFEHFLTHQAGLCLGAFENETLVAYFCGLVVQGSLDVITFATDPTRRRQGLGEALLRQVISEVDELVLEVAQSNVAAIALYKKLGFQTMGVRKKYYAGKEDALQMKLVN